MEPGDGSFEAHLQRRAFQWIAFVQAVLLVLGLAAQVLSRETQPAFWPVLLLRSLQLTLLCGAFVWALVDLRWPLWVAPTTLAVNCLLALIIVSGSGGHRLLSISIYILEATQFLLVLGIFLRRQWVTVAAGSGLLVFAALLFVVLPRETFPQEVRPVELELGFLALLFFGLTMITGFVAVSNYVAHRVTARAREIAERLRIAAFQDLATGLPNGLQLEQDMADWETLPARTRTALILAGFRLDGLEELNETQGVEATTQLVAEVLREYGVELREMARRLPEYYRPEPFRGLYRVESNLFLFTLSLPEGQKHPFSRPPALAGVIRQVLDRWPVETRLSFQGGFTVYPDDADTLRQLLRNLLNMLHSRRPDFHGRFVPFNRDLYQEHLRREELRLAMQTSLAAGDFHLVFQPKVAVATDAVSGFEALARWSRPSGPISPLVFIPLAEQTGLIGDLTRLLVSQSYDFLRRLEAAGRTDLTVSVNFSPGVFTPEFLDEIQAQLELSGYGPRFDIEITEGVLMRLSGPLQDRFTRLKALGVSFSIDDFGTGYSNLGYLQNLEADVLKVDKRFIDGIPADEKNSKLVSAIIHMAQSLGMSVVAEGVEYREQKDFLVSAGCDQIQGYFYSKPLEAEAALAFLEKNGTGH